MKRNSLTAIVEKVQRLTIWSDRETNDYAKRAVHENGELHYRYLLMIRKAAVNEIIRLDGSPATPSLGSAPAGGASDLQEEICCNLTKPKL